MLPLNKANTQTFSYPRLASTVLTKDISRTRIANRSTLDCVIQVPMPHTTDAINRITVNIALPSADSLSDKNTDQAPDFIHDDKNKTSLKKSQQE